MTARVPTEAMEQEALLAWAQDHQQAHPDLALLMHVPNGMWRAWNTAKRLKAQGVRRGAPDLLLPSPRGGFHGLWIELKRRRGGSLSPEQAWWHEQLALRGYLVAVCRGAAEARDALEHYLGLPAEGVAA